MNGIDDAWGPRGGWGGGYLSKFLLWVCAASLSLSSPIIVNSVVNYRPHIRHSWANVISYLVSFFLCIYLIKPFIKVILKGASRFVAFNLVKILTV